ncbi:M67 family metallopeptidase [Varunaivibrio sulfuroxidans]|uniref:Proteasome lid subunit RPN8/RPN11 n=1 Tax=Varunaivibrio sulfuroxidans TaxID=1773489 RepID=A0A4R3J995_9PROT|nr:M67 family metallopeptidase [Varunaivibrio sulfuroxidans]TCS62519.1 proteasome lid subunit RPN8/RPN11 [Varunaivibrio sulfuroxidans]WES30810.1 M67 family metallopeptidase [Varunaivibrio sulfuroxidans]
MIHLGAAHLAEIQDHARAAYPRECCGLLSGYGGERDDEDIHITDVTPSPNIAWENGGAPSFDRFEVDPKVRFDLMRALENAAVPGDETRRLVGHYHSHPNQVAQPSPRDIDMAFEPDLIWLIVGVDARGARRPKAFRIDRETRSIAPLTIRIDED